MLFVVSPEQSSHSAVRTNVLEPRFNFLKTDGAKEEEKSFSLLLWAEPKLIYSHPKAVSLCFGLTSGSPELLKDVFLKIVNSFLVCPRALGWGSRILAACTH